MSRNAQLIILTLLGWVLPAGAADAPSAPAGAPAPRVVVVQGHGLLNAFLPDDEKVADAFNLGLERFTGTSTVPEAWLTLVKTNDVVGLKVFSAPGELCGTRPAVIRAITRGLLDAGVPRTQIVIWDKRAEDLRAAGYFDLGEELGVPVAGAMQAGFDTNTFYLPDSPVIGTLVWGDQEFGQTNRGVGKKSFVSKLVSQRLTKIISIVPLLNENSAGVCGHFYSLAMGSVDNTHRFENDSARLAVALPEIIALPAVGDHVVLNVTDALLGQYQGGPAGFLQFSTVMNQLWFSHDPVALDVLAQQELAQARRRFHAPDFQANWEMYTNAALLQLGQNQLGRIPVEIIR